VYSIDEELAEEIESTKVIESGRRYGEKNVFI
jgi:hypothetical protein